MQVCEMGGPLLSSSRLCFVLAFRNSGFASLSTLTSGGENVLVNTSPGYMYRILHGGAKI